MNFYGINEKERERMIEELIGLNEKEKEHTISESVGSIEIILEEVDMDDEVIQYVAKEYLSKSQMEILLKYGSYKASFNSEIIFKNVVKNKNDDKNITFGGSIRNFCFYEFIGVEKCVKSIKILSITIINKDSEDGVSIRCWSVDKEKDWKAKELSGGW